MCSTTLLGFITLLLNKNVALLEYKIISSFSFQINFRGFCSTLKLKELGGGGGRNRLNKENGKKKMKNTKKKHRSL